LRTTTPVTSASNSGGISLNLSALADENMGLAIAELETSANENAQGNQEDIESAKVKVPIVLPPASETSMQDYYQLQDNLLKLTLVFTAVICLLVWGSYSLNTALNYVIGAVTGIVYFRMLARSVGKIGRGKPANTRLAVFIGVMVVAMRWQQLSVLPVFLGFLTYKVALIAFVIWTAVIPQQESISQAQNQTSS